MHGARPGRKSTELDEKFHVEKSISERLEQTLKTRLDKSYFDITVEAKLKRRLEAAPYRRPRDKSVAEAETGETECSQLGTKR